MHSTPKVERNDQLPDLLEQKRRSADPDERLNLTPLGDLLLAHPFRYFSWVALDAGDNSVRVRPLFRTLIELLDDDDLLPRLASLQHDRNLLLLFQELCALISCDSEGRSEDDEMHLSGLVDWWKLRIDINKTLYTAMTAYERPTFDHFWRGGWFKVVYTNKVPLAIEFPFRLQLEGMVLA